MTLSPQRGQPMILETPDNISPIGEKRKRGRPQSETSARAWAIRTGTSERTASRIKRGLRWLAADSDASAARVVALMGQARFRKSCIEKLARLHPYDRDLVLTELEAGLSWCDAIDRAIEVKKAAQEEVSS
jgi:hypothetical protein